MSSRAGKSGIGAQIERKMEGNYDREEEAGTPMHVVTWANAILQGEHEPCKGTGFKDLHEYFKNGDALCKLINKLLVSDGKPVVSFQKKINSPFVARTNIENFCKGMEVYGVSKESIFQTDDLYEGRKATMYNVLNGLHTLGFAANSKNFIPAYTGQMTKYLDNE